MHVALQKQGRFKLETRYPHKRSEGLRKDLRLDRLLLRTNQTWNQDPAHEATQASPTLSTPATLKVSEKADLLKT